MAAKGRLLEESRYELVIFHMVDLLSQRPATGESFELAVLRCCLFHAHYSAAAADAAL